MVLVSIESDDKGFYKIDVLKVRYGIPIGNFVQKSGGKSEKIWIYLWLEKKSNFLKLYFSKYLLPLPSTIKS